MDEKKNPEKQLNARIPDDLHRAAKAKAAMTGQTVQEVVKELLESWVKEREQQSPTPTK